MMKPNTVKTFTALALSLAVQTAFAGNIIDVNVSALPNNQRVIKVKFDRDPVKPGGFITATPAGIALDFPATGIQLAQPVFQYSDPLLKQITAAPNNDRARLSVGLSRAGQYDAKIQGNEVWVYITPAADETSRNVAPPMEYDTTAQSAGAGGTTQAAVDFRKGGGGSGVVEVRVPGFKGEPDVKRQSDRIVITLKGYHLATQAQRELDVTDFSTPVRFVTMKRLSGDTQIIIQNQGGWDLKQQVGAGRLSFEIVKKSDLESAGLKADKKAFSGRRVSLDFQDVEVRTILQILAKESGMNIVASDSVTGKMTLTLKDVPWDQALDLVMQARNLDMRRQGNIINVAPRDELLKKDEAALVAQNKLTQLGPLYSQTFQLKYRKVEEFRKVLRLEDNVSNRDGKGSILSERGSALIDPATNTLVITDNANVINKFQKLLEELDVPSRQVMVEARIVEASDGFSRDLGVKFGFQGTSARNSWSNTLDNAIANQATRINNQTTLYNNAAGGNNTIPSLEAYTFGSNVSLPISAATSSIAVVRSIASGALGLELSAQEAQNRAKTISSPRVLTQDRKQAVIESGTEVPYQEASSSGATSTSFKKAVLGLTVTPNITPDGQIIMDVKINKDSVNSSCNASEPCIDTNQLQTSAMVENGGTLILGGIYIESSSNGSSKVPLLGDIPLVGNLFKSTTRENSRQELLVFITPRIVDNVGSILRY